MRITPKAVEFLDQLRKLFQEHNVGDVYYDEDEKAICIYADDFEFGLVSYESTDGFELGEVRQE